MAQLAKRPLNVSPGELGSVSPRIGAAADGNVGAGEIAVTEPTRADHGSLDELDDSISATRKRRLHPASSLH